MAHHSGEIWSQPGGPLTRQSVTCRDSAAPLGESSERWSDELRSRRTCAGESPWSPSSSSSPSLSGTGTGTSIDWTLEFSRARARAAWIDSQPGLRGVAARLGAAAEPWVVVVVTGIVTGAIASALDILSAWLSDLRLGACKDMWWMSRGLCCAGLDRTSSSSRLFTPRDDYEGGWGCGGTRRLL